MSSKETFYHKLLQKRNLLICFGLSIYVLSILSFSTLKKEGIPVEEAVKTSSASGHQYAVWTYPEPPPSDKLRLEETLYCSYSPCQPLGVGGNDEGTVFVYTNPRVLNLKEATRKSSAKFKEFVQHSMWFKVVHGMSFPHHVQSVAILSILSANPKSCVRTLGQSTVVCSKDLHKYESYDPRDFHSAPPFAVSDLSFHQKFSILDYQNRAERSGRSNVEDEMQSLAAVQFFPYLSDYLDHDGGMPTLKGHLIASSNWERNMIAFPPPPLDQSVVSLTGMHIHGGMQDIIRKNQILNYLTQYNTIVGSIGAEDIPTFSFLSSLGLQVYMSSSLASMIDLREDSTKAKKRKLIVAVDVDPSLLPHKVARKAKMFSTTIGEKSDVYNRMKRFSYAHDLISKYAEEAKVVITSQFQSAMISMAHGIPVIFIISGEQTPVTVGNAGLFHRFDTTKGKEWNFDLDKMPPNPGVHTFDRYRASFLHYLNKQSSFYLDSARLFGMLPLQRAGKDIPTLEDYETHQEFRFMFTTPPETITKRVIRAIESVFYHHPNAKVHLHSNSIPKFGTKFDVFAESGYDFVIEEYSLEDLLHSAMFLNRANVEGLITAIEDRRSQQYWYSHETDLVRMLIMERSGGVYLDTDQHVVQPIPKSFGNVLGYQDDEESHIVNGAIMVFERHNPFLQKILKEAVRKAASAYDPNNWGIFGPNLLTEQYEQYPKKDKDVKVYKAEYFYPYLFYKAKECFTGNLEDFNPIVENTYTVHLNTKMTQEFEYAEPGSVCDLLFKSYCIFCDESLTRQ